MNNPQITLGQILAAQSVDVRTEHRRYSSDNEEAAAWHGLMATGGHVVNLLLVHAPGTVADMTPHDARVYWVQEHQGQACLCSGGASDGPNAPLDDVRLLEDIEGLSADELLQITNMLGSWLARPVFKQLGREVLEAEFRSAYGTSA